MSLTQSVLKNTPEPDSPRTLFFHIHHPAVAAAVGAAAWRLLMYMLLFTLFSPTRGRSKAVSREEGGGNRLSQRREEFKPPFPTRHRRVTPRILPS